MPKNRKQPTAGGLFLSGRNGRGLAQQETCQQVTRAADSHSYQAVRKLGDGVLNVVYLRHAGGEHCHITVKTHMRTERRAGHDGRQHQ